jgi:hypothetical protein
MKRLIRLPKSRVAGAMLPDLLVSAAITAVIAAGMLTATASLQRSGAAAYHHTRSQIQQARIIDYVARDLRRALTVTVDSFEGAERLNLTIPDFYDATKTPRDPLIVNGGISYGAASGGVPISYYKSGDKFYRREGSVATVLATGVQEFIPDFTDSGKQSVSVSISFQPKFQFGSVGNSSIRNGTMTSATTLLRNKRS